MRIIIIDDDRIVLKALKTILQQDPEITVAATGESYEDAMALHQAHRPDILLMDIRMGEKTGLDAAQDILSRDPSARILFLTTFSDDEYIMKALRIGAKGYLLKQDYESIVPALKAVASGQSVFGSEVTQALPTLLRQGPADSGAQLTSREDEILRLCAQGMSNREIAGTLFLSEGTVRNYISALLQKLDLRDRTQLVVYYYRHFKA